MEEACQELDQSSLLPCVFEISGEPAVVINGVPDISPSDCTFIPTCTVNESGSKPNTGFGEWLEGREVRKLFGDQYYSGKVVKFDQEMNWYRIEYEDGDLEDLNWHELQEVLLPLDIAIPLKTLALKILKHENYVHLSRENTVRPRKSNGNNVASKRKTREMKCRSLVIMSGGSSQIQEATGYGNFTQQKLSRPSGMRRTIKAENQK